MLFRSSAGFDEVPERVSTDAGVSTSPITNPIVMLGVSSLMVRLAISLMVGRSFTEFTVTRNVVLVVATPSLTVTMIVAVPN